MLDYNLLKEVCYAPLDYFKAFGDIVIKSDKNILRKGNAYIYGNHGGAVLGVCHLDYVSLKNHWAICDLNGLTIFNPRLDDRLGVYLLLYVLPSLVDAPYDILLTTGEELGRSSARFFEVTKDYNWIFELDRRGCDCVTYGLDSRAWRAALGAAGLSIGRGSFSDICLIDSDACMVNFGIGYREEHTRICHAFAADIVKQVKRIVKFYNAQAGNVYVADSLTYLKPISYTRDYDWGYWTGIKGKDYHNYCEFCGCDLSGEIPYIIDGATVCGACYDSYIALGSL